MSLVPRVGGRRPKTVLTAGRFRAIAAVAALAVAIPLLPAMSASAVPVPLAGRAAVYGTVTPEDPAQWSGGGSVVLSNYSGGATIATITPDSSGRFEANDLPPGQYQVRFVPPAGGPFVESTWAAPGRPVGEHKTLVAGSVLEITGTWRLGGTVSGTISADNGFELVDPVVVLRPQASSLPTLTAAVDPTTGAYTIGPIREGRYYLSAEDLGAVTDWLTYWPRSLGPDTTLDVAFGAVLTGKDILLRSQPVRSGVVTYTLLDGSTAPLEGALVSYVTGALADITSITDSQGRFYLPSPSRSYQGRIKVTPPASQPFLVPEWADNAFRWEDARTFSGPSSGVEYHNFTIGRGGAVSGAVTGPDSLPLDSAFIEAFRLDESGEIHSINRMFTGPDGTFSFLGLVPGEYFFQIVDHWQRGLDDEYWPDARYFADAEIVTIRAEEFVELGAVSLDLHSLDIDRITGTNRFGTAVEVTKRLFPSAGPDDAVGVPVVYLANAFNYPDALSAGPAAVKKGGALLTVAPDSIPAEVLTELRRLAPERIIVVGGPSMVSDRVIRELNASLGSLVEPVRRITGSNRYQTSLAIAKDAFVVQPGERIDTVFIATGNNYPDALAAGPAAASLGAPVLLVNGAASTVGSDLIDFLISRRVLNVYILGGSNSVSESIMNQLSWIHNSGYLVRITGNNRYETAMMINRSFFPRAEEAFFANGAGFADALVGGAYAGAIGAPLYLTVPHCVLPFIAEATSDQKVLGIHVLGGTNMISANVERFGICT